MDAQLPGGGAAGGVQGWRRLSHHLPVSTLGPRSKDVNSSSGALLGLEGSWAPTVGRGGSYH